MEAVSHGSQHSSEGVSDRGRCIVLVVRLLDGEAMTHDPLCPQYDCWLEGCTVCDECALIARVREDEFVYRGDINTAYEQGYAAALRDAVKAVNAVTDAIDSSAEWERDYDVDPTGQTRNPRIWVREAVAAIEELGADQ